MKNLKELLRLFFAFLCLNLTGAMAFGQSIDVSGLISSNTGETLMGVYVQEKGTSNRTISDVNGNFNMKVSSTSSTLIFSSIGYKTLEQALNGQSVLNVTLIEDVLGLEEIVVIGYGQVKKSDLTGSVSTISSENLEDRSANSVDGLLQGRSGGLQVISSSQDPGAGATIRIRGGSSLNGSNAPLVVVDGFPLGEAGDLKQINPSDIESIEVLKDASASAIYGSRGANGVIMVSTKKAKAGKTTIEFDQKTTFSQFTSKLIRWDDPLLMAQLTNEEMRNAGKAIIYNGKTNSNGVYYPSIAEIASGEWAHNTNWADVVFRETPIINNSSLSIKNGNEKTLFSLSLNYLKDNGVYIEDEYEKFIVNMNITHNITDKFKINSSTIFSQNNRNNNGGLAYWRNPLWPVYNEDGSYFQTTVTDYGNPMAITDNVLNKSKGTDFISSNLLSYEIIDGLDIKTQLNYKLGMSTQDQFNPALYTQDGAFNNGSAYMNDYNWEDILSETYITYVKTFAEKHKISAMAGHSYQYSIYKGLSLGSYDFINEALLNENMSAGNPERNTHSNSYSKTELLSYMGRVNYALDNKYLFTATFRADGSSKFGANNKWAYFPSAAVSWKAHNESFIQDLGIFDALKFRASYGISGNQGISPYQTLSIYGNETYYDNGSWNTAIGPGRVIGSEGADGRYKIWGGIPNNDLKWESTAQYNMGLDLAFFTGRLNITVDAYQKNTTDLLRQRLLSLSSGYNRIWVNDGEISNKGIELAIDGTVIDRGEFKLSSTFIFSKNKNEVVDLGNAVASGLQTDVNTNMKYEFNGYGFDQFRQTANILAIGQPTNVFYGYKTDGIIQTNTEGLEAGLTGDLALPGEFKYVDINEDGVIDTDDRTIIGDPNPDFMASLNIDMTYKNFYLSIFLNGVYGNDVLYQGRMGQADISPLRWTLDNPNNEYPSLRNGRQLKLSDWFIEDGSYLRVQNLTFGYNFNLESLPYISKAKAFVNAENLYTFTKFSGYDPEVNLDGTYWGGYPRLRRITLGVNLTF